MGEWLGSQLAGLGVVAEAALLLHERQADRSRQKISCAEASKGSIRGARAWKRVQVYAAGLTQNRRAELQSDLNTFKRAASFDHLAIVLPKWERKVRDLEHFPHAGVADDGKVDSS